jgi:hypothetical protein
MTISDAIQIAFVDDEPPASGGPEHERQAARDDEQVAPIGIEVAWATGPAPQGEAGRRLLQEVLISLGCETTAYALERVRAN